jgi:hypothetical protein
MSLSPPSHSNGACFRCRAVTWIFLVGSLLANSAVAQLIPAPARALRCDGTSGYVRWVPTNTLGTNFTVEAWVRPFTTNTHICILGTREGAEYTFDMKFSPSPSRVHGDIGNGTAWLTPSADTPLSFTSSNWYHIAYVVTPTNYTIYTNGSAAGSGAYSGTPMLYRPTSPLRVGNYGGPGEFWNGDIDEVRIWNTARSAAQIQSYYQRPALGTETNLVLLWHFDEVSGTNAIDASGSGKTGALLGGVSRVVSSAPLFNLGFSTSIFYEGREAGTNQLMLGAMPATGVWTATTTNSWLHISPGFESGTGNTNVVYTFDASDSPNLRTGIVSIAGIPVSIVQAGSNYAAGISGGIWTTDLHSPRGVAADGTGNVYVASLGNFSIQKWSPDGNMIDLITNTSDRLYSIVADVDGNVYYPGLNNHIFKRVAATGQITNLVPFNFNLITGMAVDQFGNLYIANSSSLIYKWTAANQTVSTLISGLDAARQLALDVAGNLYIVNGTSATFVLKWTAANNTLAPLDSGLNGAYRVAVDGSGNVYASFQSPGLIKKRSVIDGSITTLPFPALSFATGVTVDPMGHVYACDVSANSLLGLPRAFVETNLWQETACGGTAVTGLLPPLTSAGAYIQSGSSWLSWGGSANITVPGVAFSFADNWGASRTGTLSILGQTFPVSQSGCAIKILAGKEIQNGNYTTNLTADPFGKLTFSIITEPEDLPWYGFEGWNSIDPTNLFVANPNPAFRIGPSEVTIQASISGLASVTNLSPLTLSSPTYPGSQGFPVANSQFSVTIPITQPVTVQNITNYSGFTNNFRLRSFPITPAYTNVSEPISMAIDSSRNIYISHPSIGTVQKWNPSTRLLTTVISNGLSVQSPWSFITYGSQRVFDFAQMKSALGYSLTVDNAGNLYIADNGDLKLKKFSIPDQTLTTVLSYSNSCVIAARYDGDIYMLEDNAPYVRVLSPRNRSDRYLPMYLCRTSAGAEGYHDATNWYHSPIHGNMVGHLEMTLHAVDNYGPYFNQDVGGAAAHWTPRNLRPSSDGSVLGLDYLAMAYPENSIPRTPASTEARFFDSDRLSGGAGVPFDDNTGIAPLDRDYVTVNLSLALDASPIWLDVTAGVYQLPVQNFFDNGVWSNDDFVFHNGDGSSNLYAPTFLALGGADSLVGHVNGPYAPPPPPPALFYSSIKATNLLFSNSVISFSYPALSTFNGGGPPLQTNYASLGYGGSFIYVIQTAPRFQFATNALSFHENAGQGQIAFTTAVSAVRWNAVANDSWLTLDSTSQSGHQSKRRRRRNADIFHYAQHRRTPHWNDNIGRRQFWSDHPDGDASGAHIFAGHQCAF